MEINKLEIENFKLFAKEEFVFNPHFNLVIGVNGSGKTSLLRAISVALGNWAHGYMKDKNNYRPIFSDEIREIQINNRFDKSKKSSIKSYGKSAIINNKGNKKTVIAEWSNKYHFGIESSETLPTIEATVISAKYIESSKQHLLNFDSLGQEVLNFIEKGDNFNLPLIAFYECDRLWLASKKEPNIEEVAQIRHSRFDPYVDCFHIGLKGNSAIVEWLIQNELISLQQGEEFPVLKSIQKAATGALENCSGIRFNFKQRRVIVEFEDKTSIPFEHLSDGQRTLLGLFCDLARRAAILNPHLGGNASEETKGVVLIDELDLHLHPKWQRTVIENLRRTFPKIQFICTTHSPFLIQSLRSSEELIMLDGEPLSDYESKGIEEIAKNMGVNRPDVSIRYEEMKEAAKTYLQLLDEAESSPEERQEQYKQDLAKLIAPYADNPAYQAFLELKYETKLGE